MFSLITSLYLLGLAASAPTLTDPDPTANIVSVDVFYNATSCTDAPAAKRLHLNNTQCWPLPGHYLRVVEHGDPRLKYNSLRVYKTDDCSGGWTLQPLDDDDCSDVESFGGIRVVLFG
ncbi:hypothetical protein K504DRAFT_451822 [Pleomassaria siparia CBS 279.74]|uniref:Uncharacterized protein n=1 Tax=Pleomassaria siparia CBS 279.74 TaxID=1314801 RepID=A0A6G1JSM9_9PLEO|nr:hypothetical protein K504DRAFT_451822 [Pleomassaria siparia CBS 279.74]